MVKCAGKNNTRPVSDVYVCNFESCADFKYSLQHRYRRTVKVYCIFEDLQDTIDAIQTSEVRLCQ